MSSSPFDEVMARLREEGLKLDAILTAGEPIRESGRMSLKFNGIELSDLPSFEVDVQKIGTTLQVSDYLLSPEKYPPVTIPWRIRLRSWWWEHRPHLHFGPCPIEEDW